MATVYSAVPVSAPIDTTKYGYDPEKQQDKPTTSTTPQPQSRSGNGVLKYILLTAVACLSLVAAGVTVVWKHWDEVEEAFGCSYPTKAGGGGRDWIVNEDGTISAKHGSDVGDEDLVLGVGDFPMVLVKKGDKRQFVFNSEDLEALENGETRSLSYTNKVGDEEEVAFIGKMYTTERYADFPNGQMWRYIESAKTIDKEKAVNVQYVNNQFISLVNDDLVFDIAYWKYAENVPVNFVGGANDESPTMLEGGGRDFTLNLEDGTIASSMNPDLVLGEGRPTMVLVKRGDPNQIIFEKSNEFAQGNVIPAILSSPPGLSLGRKYAGEKIYEGWRYSESAFYYNDEKAIDLQYEDGNFILLPGEDLVFDVSFWKMYEGNTVNFVGGKC